MVISPLSGFDPQTVQRVASHYIDCSTPAHIRSRVYSKEQILCRIYSVDGNGWICLWHTGEMTDDRENPKRSESLSTMLGADCTLTALGSKLDLGGESPVNNGLNSSTSSEAKVKAINTTHGTKQVTTGLLLSSPWFQNCTKLYFRITVFINCISVTLVQPHWNT